MRKTARSFHAILIAILPGIPKRNLLTIVIVFVILSVGLSQNKSNKVEVKHYGALKNMMHKGDISAKIDLIEIQEIDHLYALGAFENLKGEIQIFDSKPFSTINDNGEMTVDTSYNGKATLLVYASVEDWQSINIPNHITTYVQFEEFVEKTAKANHINTNEPFPFLVEGVTKSIEWHVIDWKDGDIEHTHEKHKTSGLYGILQDTEVTLLGFYSNAHHTIFTHHTTNMHIHMKTIDHKIAGHVDGLVLGDGMFLKLPFVK